MLIWRWVSLASARGSIRHWRQHLPAFKFVDLGLEVEAVLSFKLDPVLHCVVATENRVEFQGQLVSLSAAAVLALQQAGRCVKAARGPDYWCYQGKSLSKYRQLPNR